MLRVANNFGDWRGRRFDFALTFATLHFNNNNMRRMRTICINKALANTKQLFPTSCAMETSLEILYVKSKMFYLR